MGFSESVRNRVLLWCDRHCCLCKKQCHFNIEVHHIVPESKGGTDDIENAIPLCFECHAFVGHYNEQHSRGTKYKAEELKQRRNQVYDEFTRHLIPPLDYEITNVLPDGERRQLPDVGFRISHYGNSLPVRVKVEVEIIHDGKSYRRLKSEFYDGTRPWHLNPNLKQTGHFSLPKEIVSDGSIELIVSLQIQDVYEYCHDWLPVSFEYNRDKDYWFLVPSPSK